MRRREFIAVFGSAAAAPLIWPLAPRAQQPSAERMPRIGTVFPFGGPQREIESGAFRNALQTLGWTDGVNIRIDPVAAHEDLERAVVKLLGMQPDITLAVGMEALVALQNHTKSAPIVFVLVSDPLGSGVVRSLARPGGNVTGFMNFEYSIVGKWIAMLKEIAPLVGHAMVMDYPGKSTWPGYAREIDIVAQSLGMPVVPAFVRNAAEIEASINDLVREPNGGLIVMPDAITNQHRSSIVRLAAQHRVPAVYPYRIFAADGGLVSYGIDRIEIMRQAATYVDRILRGEKPGDLPVQAPTKFELVINLNTANALGLTVPPSLLANADEVIE